MALWLVRAGQYGEQEQGAIKNSVVAIGWNELPNLSDVKTKEELRSIYERTYRDEKVTTVANRVGQIWTFLKRIEKDHLVVLPFKRDEKRSFVEIGKVKGPYEYRTDLSAEMIHHTHPVEWLKEVPKTAFDQTMLYSLGAFMTVCEISRDKAEEKVLALIKGSKPSPIEAAGSAGEEEPIDIPQLAHDQILTLINRKFKGHPLARLVEAVLQAEGYTTKRSEPGRDGGVDILAAKGHLGFDAPKICVQVKSSDSPLDVTSLRELDGVVSKFNASHGLLVSWGGFKSSVLEEARSSFFRIRLWDSGNLIDSVLQNYDRLPEDLRAELALKRVWAQVLED
jgi:restriction system protein